MPEYIPKANYPEGLASKVLELQSQQINPTETLIKSLGEIGGGYFKAKKEKKSAEMKRMQELDDEKMKLEGDLSKSSMNDFTEGKARLKMVPTGEVDANGKPKLRPVEMPKEPHKLYTAFEPDEEYTKAKKGGYSSELNSPASEYTLDQIDSLNDYLAKLTDPKAEGVKVARDGKMTLREALSIRKSLETAYLARTKEATAAAGIPTKENVQRAKETAGEMGSALKQVVPPKEPKKEAAKPIAASPEIIAVIEKTKGIKTPTSNLYESVKASANEKKSGAINAIMKQTGVGAVEAEQIYNEIRK